MNIRLETFDILGAPLEGENPLPRFRARKPAIHKYSERFPHELRESLGTHTKVLPYLMQDRYSRKRLPLKIKSFVLENRYLCARFFPEYGGRLHSLYDKIEKRELLFTNSVIQPGNLAIRNAWLSGGIEWNIGNIGHCPTTCDNVFCAILKDDEGNDFLRIYEFERLKSIFWQVDFHLPEDAKMLISHVRLINPFDCATTAYWWSNVAVPDTGKTRVLCSGKQVFSFTNGVCDYERLPFLDAFVGKDLSYPSNATRSFDYFIQNEENKYSTWEAAAYEDGLVFFERSTAPLYYKKLFGWGNHHAGKHWQEYLSDGKGTGYYAELQAGIAPSQLSDKLFPAHSTFEWTQCFGGISCSKDHLFCEDFDKACDYFDSRLESVLSEKDIEALDKKLSHLADIEVQPNDICHYGSGFGALEIMRMQTDKDGTPPKTLLFPAESITEKETPWLALLKNGALPYDAPNTFPKSYQISEKWLPHIERSLKKDGGKHYLSLLHYGVAMYEKADHTVLCNQSYNEEKDKWQIEQAQNAWLESASLTPNLLAYRNLAVLQKLLGNMDKAEEYYDLAISTENAYDDFALASEYLVFLTSQKKYQKTWELYLSLPEYCKITDRICISAASAAVQLDKFDYLEDFFAREHYDVKEGECSLTDIWFLFCARKMAKERGVDTASEIEMQKLVDEAWDTCPPPESIDFRMSFDKKLKYRI
jgi:hypothetical protein